MEWEREVRPGFSPVTPGVWEFPLRLTVSEVALNLLNLVRVCVEHL